MSLKFDPDAASTPQETAAPAAGSGRRRWFGEPGRVVWVVALVVLGTVLPLIWMPLSSPIGWAGLAGGLLIAFLIAASIKKEIDRISWREEQRAAPRCRLCGKRYDEPLEAETGEPGVVGVVGVEEPRRCGECGRPTRDAGTSA